MDGLGLSTDLLTLLLFAVGGTGLGILGLLRTTAPRDRLTAVFLCAVALVLIASGVAAAGLGQPPTLWVPALILGAVPAAARVVASAGFRSACTRVGTLLLNPYCHWGLVFVLSPALAVAWAYHTEQTRGAPFIDLESILVVPAPALREVRDSYAVTDLGHHVPLYINQLDAELAAETARRENNYLQNEHWLPRLLRTGSADPAYNCHGWIFAGGHYWVRSEDVDLILQDNGYSPVPFPQAHDLAIFRDGQGRVSHSGLVHAVGDDGLVLLESKWGGLGRYVHRPQDQCYGSNCTYYRSPRAGHCLRDLHEAHSREAPLGKGVLGG